ncbi:hypothetical protein HYALB_00013088 [Hymenoscyphus albidus]|uniref:Uncharacterized protein n=1 Tax=Hymenoscyphus albidus TaxID=595503 RepID=A0A9N9LWT7_9HELO|nr:hypothetical protein HYALB_00013088 [Hymenoscyphus albidus]
MSNLALSSMQHQGPSKTLEAAERPTSLPSSSSSSISRETKVGFGVGVSLGFLILVSIIILAFRIGRKTGMGSAAAKKARSFQDLSRLSGAWFRKSGFGKAESCAESQQIFEIGSGKSEVKVGELEANTKVVELEGDDVGGDEAVQSEKSFVCSINGHVATRLAFVDLMITAGGHQLGKIGGTFFGGAQANRIPAYFVHREGVNVLYRGILYARKSRQPIEKSPIPKASHSFNSLR